MLKSMKSHHAHETVTLLQRETSEFILPQVWSPNSSDVNPVDYSVWSILQERVYNSRIHIPQYEGVERTSAEGVEAAGPLHRHCGGHCTVAYSFEHVCVKGGHSEHKF